MVSAANNQENDGGVKVLRQKDETKNKNEKKITETGIETKTSELFSDFQTVLLPSVSAITAEQNQKRIEN
jgi:hypothetical protein